MKDYLKIDFIIGRMEAGGAQRVVSILANYFAEKGHHVRIITFIESDDYVLHPHVERIKFHKKIFINYATVRGFFSLLQFYLKKRNRPDVISSHIALMGYATILPAKLYGIKLVVSEHFNHLNQKRTLAKWILWKVLYRLPDAVTVLTKFDLPFFKKTNNRTFIMENPCSFIANEEINGNRENKILAVGNLDRYNHKGFDNLLDIINEVFKTNPGWNLQIVGSGEVGLKYLIDKAKELGLENKVEFLGYRKDVKKLMSNSEVFILTSRREGLPMVLIEAMSQGMACIAYDCISGPSEIISNGENGILVSDQNKDEMIMKLDELLKNEKLRISLKANSVKSLDKFSIENIGRKWEELFNSFF